MSSTTQETLWRTFLAISGDGGELAGLLGNMATQGNAAPKAAGAQPQTTASAVESTIETVFKSGLGLAPLVGGLLGLFGGSDDSPPATLAKYAMPPRISFEAAETAAGMRNVDYDQAGSPRAYGNAGSSESRTAPQVTVNVQAMDARSFLDRSGDIAAAVREAMLNLNPINDVVNEL
jgi:hypothetical protein